MLDLSCIPDKAIHKYYLLSHKKQNIISIKESLNCCLFGFLFKQNEDPTQIFIAAG